MSETNSALLESLRPSQKAAIMDVVAAAGIDVSKWAIKQDGTPVQEPKKNPNYCYEWAFGGGEEPTLLCVWHRSLAESKGSIDYEGNLRELALSLDRVAIDRTNPAHVKSRARDQAKRARNFDSLLQRAYRYQKPVRVVLLLGEPRSETEIGWDTSKVKFRLLDSEHWTINTYNDGDGSFHMVRGIQDVIDVTEGSHEEPTFVDQFSLPEPPEKLQTAGSAYPRSREVRENVLRRAGGVCEFCFQPGFKMHNGAIFLETHHVVPLSELGADVVWNVVALCPNDHRRAHFSLDSMEMRGKLQAKLLAAYPGARDAIQAMLDATQKHTRG
jgi:5-methylcytosine-specific restriction protein A